MPSVRLHDLRHFTATQLIAAGMTPVEVAEWMGHSDPSITMRVYAHATEVGQRRASETIGDLLA
jgi:integrase